jgi:DNA-binding response OmpR family regulator
MITCPNCGFRHSGQAFAAEIDGVRLPRVQFDIILRLRQGGGALVSNAQIVDFLYGDRPDGGPLGAYNNIYTYISRAKKKIEAVGWTVIAERFRGYRLVRMAGPTAPTKGEEVAA